MRKFHVATDRKIGEICRAWSKEYPPAGWEHIDDPEACEVFISILYAKLISEQFIQGRRCFNFHPGVLPMYRGSGAFSWVILNGEHEAGVTLHVMDKDIDHGPIIDIYRFPIFPTDTAEMLYEHACAYIFQAFKEWLPRLLAGDYNSVPQNENDAHLYTRKSLEKAKDLTRFVRAFTFKGKENAYHVRDGEKVYL